MISILHPSRGRPQRAYETARKWLDNAGCDCEYILSLDEDDPTLSRYPLNTNETHVIINNNKSVVEATNQAAKKAEGEILIYLSDDFDCPPLWGPMILKEFQNEDRPLIIKVDDCFQPLGIAILTIPIMNRKLYEKLGYFWHPGYKSMFVDEDLYWTSRKLGALKFSEHLKFPHLHKKDGDDSTYQASAKNWGQGKEFFMQRRGAGFP